MSAELTLQWGDRFTIRTPLMELRVRVDASSGVVTAYAINTVPDALKGSLDHKTLVVPMHLGPNEDVGHSEECRFVIAPASRSSSDTTEPRVKSD